MAEKLSEHMRAALVRLQGGGLFEYNSSAGYYYISRSDTVPGVNDWLRFSDKTIKALRRRGYITDGLDAKITVEGRTALGL